jgi:signal transduction histidine kinase
MVPRLVVRLFIIGAATAVAIAFAITEATRVEELARLREQVALADYRAQLSQEMHDGIQHYLVRIGTRLNLAAALAKTDPEGAVRMATGEALAVRQAGDELRYLVRRLRSPLVQRLGFIGALEGHLSLCGERAGCQAKLEIQGEPGRMAPDVEQAAFRILQEALTNVEKYALAAHVTVGVTFGPERLECTVTDDGVGFDASASPEAPGLQGGFGLPGMRERAQSVGGEVVIESAPGAGTTVRFLVPLVGGDGEGTEDDGEDPAPDR